MTGQRRRSSRPRVVLDTKIVLSSLVFGKGVSVMLRHAWQAGRCRPLVSTATAKELIRVLAYPKFKLAPDEQSALLADYLPYCETIAIPAPPPKTPDCRDPFDVPFLQLALAGRADLLVTGDRDILAVAAEFACPIVRLDEALLRLVPND